MNVTDMVLYYAFFGALNGWIVNECVNRELYKKLKLNLFYFNAYIFILWPIFFTAYIYLAIIGASKHEN